jgi:tetratricopeptide (TPR) repeat protein
MSIRPILLAATIAVSLWAAADPAVQEAKKLVTAKKYDEAIATLEKAQKAHPKALDVQKGLAETHLAQADSFMYNDALPPRMKYPQALRAYRKVLQYDKTNKKAQEGIASIEGIYKSMGRPIPQ